MTPPLTPGQRADRALLRYRRDTFAAVLRVHLALAALRLNEDEIVEKVVEAEWAARYAAHEHAEGERT